MKQIFTLICVLLNVLVNAQPARHMNSRTDYIEKYKEEAIKEMLLNGIPASITLAQAMVESGNGNSPLAMYANNHFGIKCHKSWTGFSYTLDDDAANECFRKYESVHASYSDHSQFLKTRRWYAPLFELKITDYKGWAYGLKKAGYATHPHYAEMLIEVIEEYKLYELDKLGEIVREPLNISPDIKLKPIAAETRKVINKNNIRYTVAKPGDTFEKIAIDLNLSTKKITKYNKHIDSLKENTIVYLDDHYNYPGNKGKTFFKRKGLKKKAVYDLPLISAE